MPTFSDRDAFRSVVDDTRIHVGFELECASQVDVFGFQRRLIDANLGFTDWRSGGNLRASQGYGHGYVDIWNVETDSSVPTSDTHRNKVEFKSPPLPIGEILNWIDKLFPLISTWAAAVGTNTGFHTSYSIQGVNLERSTNFLKLLMLLGESHMAESLGRSRNQYANQLYEQVKERVRNEYEGEDTPSEKAKYIKKLLDNRIQWSQFYPRLDRYLSINFNHLSTRNYVEFRLLGGVDYLSKPDEIKRAIARFGYALKVASNKNLLREEYSHKLYAILSNTDTENLEVRLTDVIWVTDTARHTVTIKHRQEDKTYLVLHFHDIGDQRSIYDYRWVERPDNRQTLAVVQRRIAMFLSRPNNCTSIDLPLIYTENLLGSLSYAQIVDIAMTNTGTWPWALRNFNKMHTEPPAALANRILAGRNQEAIRELAAIVIKYGSDRDLTAVTSRIISDPHVYGMFVNTHGEIIDRDGYWGRQQILDSARYLAFERELLEKFEDSDDLGLEDLGNQDLEDVHYEPTSIPQRRSRGSRASSRGAED